MILQKEFYFIRHGQTDENFNLSLTSRREDIPLNQAGVAQAKDIEPLVALLPIKSICFSPLQRAKQTKDICCSKLGPIAQYELPNLSECDLEIWQQINALGVAASTCTQEPVCSFMKRVRIGINEALSKEGPVLIVAHGGIHWAMCCFMQVTHNWVIDHCVPVHFSCVSGQWTARKLKR